MGTEDTDNSQVRSRSASSRAAMRWLVALGVGAIALAAWSTYPTAPKLAFSAGQGEQILPAGAGARAIAELRERLARETERMREAAVSALDAPSTAEEAFKALPGPRPGEPEWGLMLYQDGARWAWSGRLRVETDGLSDPLSVTAGRFFTTINAVAIRGNRRAVASMIVHAEPPGDRLAAALDEETAARHPVASFVYTFGDSVPAATVLVRDPAGDPLLSVHAVPLSAGEIGLRSISVARRRIAGALALTLGALLVVAFHSRRIGHRFFALAVCAASIAIVPLNSFSNDARWFNPSYYYSPTLGRWSASAAALTLTAILLVLFLYAIVRARLRPRSTTVRIAGAIAAGIAALYLLTELAKGIGQPPRGSTMPLWLMWELPLFLACFALLALAVWLGGGFFPRRRRSWQAYAAVAAASAVLSASLVWLTTTQQRMTLAEADTASLKSGDEYAAALLDRFRDQLSVGKPPVTRADLLQRYVMSELAIAGYPLSLRSWSGSAAPIAAFDAARVVQDMAAVESSVRFAIATREAVSRRVLSGAGAQQLLVVPHDGGATSVAVLPRTRLIPPDPFAPLLGLPPPVQESAPYVMYLAERPATGKPTSSTALTWRRIGNELHADAAIETVSGPARVHLEVHTRSPWALLQRLVLVVLLNALVAWVLWILAVATEGGAARRARVRARHWARSYRARLTLALFVFFMAPALAFSLWSYRRIGSDFRQTRQLLVRETLNAVTAADAARNVALVGDRFGLPLFLYRGGGLAETSDALYWALSPLGRALHPDVFRALDIGHEITASTSQRIAGSDVLLGYRASVGSSGDRFVIAVPARGDDEVLARRRNDLGVLLLFATALGGIAALLLSGIAARQFAAPIDALRRSVRAIARGEEDLPLPSAPPTEFSQAFAAVRRMADDLDASRRELARAERVLAWGEMARQVAHEIKNPLTPMRLGVQHLQRARRDPRVDFDKVFDANMRRMLEEIDRLDHIARSFSRYGSAQPDLPPAEAVDASAIVNDVIELERMAGAGVDWTVAGTDSMVTVMARAAELREVLLNVLENARHAGATRVSVAVRRSADGVTITMEDDGSGIAQDALPRIFEPHFSTRTTGSGLGLAISRRLVEAWGGSISVDSEPGSGTTVRITLRAVAANRP